MKCKYNIFSFILIALFSVNVSYAQQFPNPLHIPDTITGTTFNLTVAPSSVEFFQGVQTPTFGINGDYLGPTLIMNAGDFVQMNVTNMLGETTTMHWHGMHVAPEDDGGPHTPILDSMTWSPDFTVIEEATTFWYHPHLHHHTAMQVNKGAAGMIIIRDDNPVGDQLPHTYGVDEFPLIIQDKSFDDNRDFIFTILADTMMVNGTLGPHLDVPNQMVRFHMLNASMQRVYNLGLPPNLDVWIIGSDGGLLQRRLPANRIQMSPGERYEIVVDFASTNDTSIIMRSFSSELPPGVSGGPRRPRGGPGGIQNDTNFRPNRLDSADFEVIEFRVKPATANAITTIPVDLNTITRPNPNTVDHQRTKIFTVDSSGFPFYINGTVMDMMVINDTVELDDTEIWTLINLTDVAHPWHIHDIQFYVLDINGNPPPPHLAGRKDVINVEPFDTIRYITTFDDFANDSIPYMFHCHNLFHEDGGMMGQFIVVNTTDIEENEEKLSRQYEHFPNPTNGSFQIRSKDGKVPDLRQIELWSVEGKLLELLDGNIINSTIELDLSNYPNGNYLIRLNHKDGEVKTMKLQKIE